MQIDRPWIAMTPLLLALAFSQFAIAQAPAPEEIHLSPEAKAMKLVNNIAKKMIPHNYVNEKKWGLQKEIVSGLKVRREGLRITTKRRRKKVNHGTWKRYEVKLLEPERQLNISIAKVEKLDGGRVAIYFQIDAAVYILGRIAQWQRGVQLLSISADADAKVRLNVRCELSLALDAKAFPPDVVVNAKATHADIKIESFRLRHLSNLRGSVAKQLGDSVKGVLQDKVTEKQHKIVTKINKEIEKNSDDLRLSLREATDKFKEFLPTSTTKE